MTQYNFTIVDKLRFPDFLQFPPAQEYKLRFI